MVADGETPWCFSFKSGFPFDGWPGTNLLESLVLRYAGTDAYDAWVAGDLASTSPDIAEAGRYANSLIFGDGFVRNGSASITSNEFPVDLLFLLNRDSESTATAPQCWFVHQADFLFQTVPPGNEVGVDLGAFVLPPVNVGDDVPVKAAVSTASGLSDRPEVRVFLEFLASPEFGSTWAAQPESGFLSTNRRFDSSAFGLAGDPNADIRRDGQQALADAIERGTLRGDGSDLMPPEIGGITEAGEPGAFYQGMVDWANGVRSLDQVFVALDTAWDEWRANQVDEEEQPSLDVEASGDDTSVSLPGDEPQPAPTIGEDGVFEVESFESGPQVPGTYRSDVLGTPITVTLEGAWIAPVSRPGHTVFIDPGSIGVGQRDITLLRPHILANPADPGGAPEPGAFLPAEDIEAWLADLVDGIVTRAPERVRFGGQEAVYFEVEVTDPGVCGSFIFCAGFIANAIEPDGNISGWSFEPGNYQRIWWVDQGDERPVVVIASTRNDDRGFDSRADELLDSLIFGDPQPHPLSPDEAGVTGLIAN